MARPPRDGSPSGTRAPVGIYFLRVELGALHQTRKVALLE